MVPYNDNLLSIHDLGYKCIIQITLLKIIAYNYNLQNNERIQYKTIDIQNKSNKGPLRLAIT